MQLAMVGLGRMGANLVRRLMRAGHSCVVYDANLSAVEALASEGAVPAQDLGALVASMDAPRAVWVMLPHGETTEGTIAELQRHLRPGDLVIDGGNSHFHDDARRAKALAQHSIDYLDIGTSGGVWGLERGYCLMIGGPASAVQRLAPIFDALAPGAGDAGAHRASQRAARQRGARLAALRSRGCGPLREDDPQRHRVRNDAGARRGLRHPAQRQQGDAAARSTATTSTSPTWPRCGGAAAWCRRGCSTWRPTRWPKTATSRRTPAWSKTPAKAAGPCRPRSTKRCRPRC